MTVDRPSVRSDLGAMLTGTTLAFAGGVLGNGLFYVFGLVIARTLGAGPVGLFFLAAIFMQMASTTFRIGLPEGLLRFLSIHRGRGDAERLRGDALTAMTAGTLLSVAAAALTHRFAELLAAVVLRQPESAIYLRWIAGALPFFSLLVITTNGLLAMRRMGLVVLSRDLLPPLVMVPIGASLFAATRRIESYLFAYLVANAVAAVTAVFLLFRADPAFRPGVRTRYDWKPLLAFSIPAAGSTLVFYLFRWIDVFFLSAFRGPKEVGVYQAALRTTLVLFFLAASAKSLFGPIIADHFHQKRHGDVETILKTMIRWSLAAGVPMAALLAVLGREILALWGPEFTAGAPALAVLAFGQLLFVVTSLLGFTLLMCGRPYMELVDMAAITVLLVLLDVAWIPQAGMNGAAGAMLVAQVLGLAVRAFQVRRTLGVPLFTWRYAKPLVAALPAAAAILLLRASLHGKIVSSPPLAIAGWVILLAAAGGAIYSAALYLLRPEAADREVLAELRAKRSAPRTADARTDGKGIGGGP